MSDRDQQHNSTNRQQGENIQSRQVVSPGGTVRVLSPGGTSRIMPPPQPDQSALIQQRGRNTTFQAFSGTQTPARQSEGRIRFNRPSYDLNTRRIRHESRIPSRSPNSRRRISFTPPREGERTQRSSHSFSITPSQRRHEEELLWQRREASGHRNTPSTDLASKSREPPVNPAQALTMGTGASPFSATVQSYYVGRHVKVPDFEKYDDTSDPFDHILTFKARMVLCGDEDALYCKLFPTTLSGEALRWFHNLPPSSIHNFSQLASEFALHYRFN